MSCILLGDFESFSRLKIPMFLERVSAGIYPGEVLADRPLKGKHGSIIRSIMRGEQG